MKAMAQKHHVTFLNYMSELYFIINLEQPQFYLAYVISGRRATSFEKEVHIVSKVDVTPLLHQNFNGLNEFWTLASHSSLKSLLFLSLLPSALEDKDIFENFRMYLTKQVLGFFIDSFEHQQEKILSPDSDKMLLENEHEEFKVLCPFFRNKYEKILSSGCFSTHILNFYSTVYRQIKGLEYKSCPFGF
jgi:hypothetical protein